MADLRYALEPNGPKRLELKWGSLGTSLAIHLDGKHVHTIKGVSKMRDGTNVALPDGSVLRLQVVDTIWTTEVRLERNGQPVPGSASDPQQRLKAAYQAACGLGVLSVILGLASFSGQSDIIQELAVSRYTVGFGVALLLAGYFIRRGSLVALVVAVSAFALDRQQSKTQDAVEGHMPSIIGLFVRVAMLVLMGEGIVALRSLRRT